MAGRLHFVVSLFNLETKLYDVVTGVKLALDALLVSKGKRRLFAAIKTQV